MCSWRTNITYSWERNEYHEMNIHSGHAVISLIEAEWRIYASENYVIVGSDNGLSPVRRQAII